MPQMETFKYLAEDTHARAQSLVKSVAEATVRNKKMENPAFERDGAAAGGSGASQAQRSIELGLGAVETPRNGIICTDLCRTQLPPLAHKQPPSPWNHLKTVFLATIVAILVVWVIVFTTLSQLGYF